MWGKGSKYVIALSQENVIKIQINVDSYYAAYSKPLKYSSYTVVEKK